MNLDHAALAKANADPRVGVIVDAPYASAPLVIAFGFANWAALPRFDFAAPLRRVAQEDGVPLNIVLVRDTANLWYKHGVTSLGRNANETAVGLLDIVEQLAPTALATVGQSMGGHAAIMFGTLLEADHVLAFGPLSYLRSDWARRDGDLRWLAVMEDLDRYPPQYVYDDLPAQLRAAALPPPIHAFFGIATAPSDHVPNFDALHAERFAAINTVRVEMLSNAPHAVVKWLRDAERLDRVLREHLLAPLTVAGRRPPRLRAPAILRADPAPFKEWSDGWRSWIAENLALDKGEGSLLSTLVAKGFHPGEARREIDIAARSPYLVTLTRLLERSVSTGSQPDASGPRLSANS